MYNVTCSHINEIPILYECVIDMTGYEEFLRELQNELFDNLQNDATQNLSEKDICLISSAYEKASTIEREILQDITKYPILRSNLGEILCGAHVIIPDKGFLYDQWRNRYRFQIMERISTHHKESIAKQFGLAGNFFHEFLFGVTGRSDTRRTWFQLERTPFRKTIKNTFYHSVDAVNYLVRGKNVGPYGYSVRTEKNAIIAYDEENL